MATVKQTKIFNGNTGSSEWSWKQDVIESFNDDYITTNKSIITVNTYLTRVRSNSSFGGNADCNIKCKNSSGTVIFNKDVNKTFNYPTYVYVNNWLLIQSETFEVLHNADGSQKITVESMLNTSDFAPNWTYVSGEMALTTIPRTSKVTCPSFNIGNSTTINIESASKTFTHTLTYQFGTATGPIVAKTTSTSVGWTPSTDIFYGQTTNVTSRKGKVICQTYSGDTLIGTSEAEFTAYVTQANPDVTATIVDTNSTTIALTGDSSKLVRYYSKPKVTINATAKNKATISSYKTTIADNQQSTTQVTTFPKIDTNGITVSATDSRGWTGSKSYTPSFVNYIKLAFTSIDIDRTESTSTTVHFNIKGNYFNASFGASSNTLTLKWRWRKVGGDWSDYINYNPTISGNTFVMNVSSGMVFDNNTDYEIEVLVSDKLTTNISTGVVLVTKGTGVIDIFKDKIQSNVDVNLKDSNLKLDYEINNFLPRKDLKSFMNYTDTLPSGDASTGAYWQKIPAGLWTAWAATTTGNAVTNKPYDYAYYIVFRNNLTPEPVVLAFNCLDGSMSILKITWNGNVQYGWQSLVKFKNNILFSLKQVNTNTTYTLENGTKFSDYQFIEFGCQQNNSVVSYEKLKNGNTKYVQLKYYENLANNSKTEIIIALEYISDTQFKCVKSGFTSDGNVITNNPYVLVIRGINYK